jgi:hypothetical protein
MSAVRKLALVTIASVTGLVESSNLLAIVDCDNPVSSAGVKLAPAWKKRFPKSKKGIEPPGPAPFTGKYFSMSYFETKALSALVIDISGW